MLNTATKITLGRLILVFPVLFLLWFPSYRIIAIVLFVVLSLMDALDGYVARKMDQVTRIGTILDPVADKLTILGLLIILPLIYPYFPIWFSLIIIGRDIVIVFGWTVHYYLTGNAIMIPSRLGKITMFIQYTTISVAVLMVTLYAYDIDPLSNKVWLANFILLAVSFLTIFTSVDYMFALIHHGFKSHPGTVSPMDLVKDRRDLRRAKKRKPMARRRIMKHVYKKRKEAKDLPLYKAILIENFPKRRVCQICQGTMRKTSVLRCRCGRFFHNECIQKTIGECPRCGTVMHLDKKRIPKEDIIKGLLRTS